MRVSLGDDVVVQLPENATTGYRWDVDRIEGGLEVTSSDYRTGDRPVLPGAGGTRVLRVHPTAIGEGRLELLLKRPWGQDVADRYGLRVHVSSQGR